MKKHAYHLSLLSVCLLLATQVYAQKSNTENLPSITTIPYEFFETFSETNNKDAIFAAIGVEIPISPNHRNDNDIYHSKKYRIDKSLHKEVFYWINKDPKEFKVWLKETEQNPSIIEFSISYKRSDPSIDDFSFDFVDNLEDLSKKDRFYKLFGQSPENIKIHRLHKCYDGWKWGKQVYELTLKNGKKIYMDASYSETVMGASTLFFSKKDEGIECLDGEEVKD